MISKQLHTKVAGKVRALLFTSMAGVSALSLGACGGSPDGGAEVGEGHDAIIGGTVPSTFGPGIVAVFSTFPGVGTGRCSGVFITRFDLLTAAHCLKDEYGNVASRVDVVFGKTWSGTKYRAAGYVVHPEWEENLTGTQWDIAVVGFDTPVANSGSAMPYADWMPDGSHLGHRVVMAGYGAANADGRTGMGTKRWAYGNITANDGETLNVVGDNAGVCAADSGGPIFESHGGVWTVVGIISASNRAGCTTDSEASASMPSANVDFIEENLTIQSTN
jgi:V8-like Glu-specific endopeptidase